MLGNNTCTLINLRTVLDPTRHHGIPTYTNVHDLNFYEITIVAFESKAHHICYGEITSGQSDELYLILGHPTWGFFFWDDLDMKFPSLAACILTFSFEIMLASASSLADMCWTKRLANILL